MLKRNNFFIKKPSVRVHRRKKTELIVLGAGGHATAILGTLLEHPYYKVVALLEKEPQKTELLGLPIKDEKLVKYYKDCAVPYAFVAVGDPHTRKKLSAWLCRLGFRFINVVNHTSYVSQHTRLGNGVAILPNSSVIAGAEIGDGVIINTNACVDHECKVGNYCCINSNATLCGKVVIGNCTFIGAGATIKPEVTIGSNCIIGAGAVVISDVPDNTTVVGVPAKKK